VGESTAASAANAAPHTAAPIVLPAGPDRSVHWLDNTAPIGGREATRRTTSITSGGMVGTTVADRQLADVGTWLQYTHRHVGDDGCAAGCHGRLPCHGHRLGAHVLRAAIGPWHVRQTVRTDLASSGVLATGGTPYVH
jgi:hypothetical protein